MWRKGRVSPRGESDISAGSRCDIVSRSETAIFTLCESDMSPSGDVNAADSGVMTTKDYKKTLISEGKALHTLTSVFLFYVN